MGNPLVSINIRLSETSVNALQISRGVAEIAYVRACLQLNSNRFSVRLFKNEHLNIVRMKDNATHP